LKTPVKLLSPGTIFTRSDIQSREQQDCPMAKIIAGVTIRQGFDQQNKSAAAIPLRPVVPLPWFWGNDSEIDP
jgi:hypothetical protein